jgi:hypothetical protein
MYSLLQFCPPYEALSYVWEAEPGYRQISLDGKPHLATTNLFLALRRLRREEEVLSIWVRFIGDVQESIAGLESTRVIQVRYEPK